MTLIGLRPLDRRGRAQIGEAGSVFRIPNKHAAFTVDDFTSAAHGGILGSYRFVDRPLYERSHGCHALRAFLRYSSQQGV